MFPPICPRPTKPNAVTRPSFRAAKWGRGSKDDRAPPSTAERLAPPLGFEGAFRVAGAVELVERRDVFVRECEIEELRVFCDPRRWLDFWIAGPTVIVASLSGEMATVIRPRRPSHRDHPITHHVAGFDNVAVDRDRAGRPRAPTTGPATRAHAPHNPAPPAHIKPGHRACCGVPGQIRRSTGVRRRRPERHNPRGRKHDPSSWSIKSGP